MRPQRHAVWPSADPSQPPPPPPPASLSHTARRRATEAVVSILTLPPLSFADVYALWATLPYPYSPPDQPPPQPPAVTVQDPKVYVPWSYTLAASYLVRGLASWQVCSAGSLHIALRVEPCWHPGAPALLIICPPAAVCWALALLAEAEARPSWAGVALLTAVPPGDGALPLPAPMTPYACGPLWLYTTAGVAQRWALTPASDTQRPRLVCIVREAEVRRGPAPEPLAPVTAPGPYKTARRRGTQPT